MSINPNEILWDEDPIDRSDFVWDNSAGDAAPSEIDLEPGKGRIESVKDQIGTIGKGIDLLSYPAKQKIAEVMVAPSKAAEYVQKGFEHVKSKMPDIEFPENEFITKSKEMLGELQEDNPESTLYSGEFMSPGTLTEVIGGLATFPTAQLPMLVDQQIKKAIGESATEISGEELPTLVEATKEMFGPIVQAVGGNPGPLKQQMETDIWSSIFAVGGIVGGFHGGARVGRKGLNIHKAKKAKADFSEKVGGILEDVSSGRVSSSAADNQIVSMWRENGLDVADLSLAVTELDSIQRVIPINKNFPEGHPGQMFRKIPVGQQIPEGGQRLLGTKQRTIPIGEELPQGHPGERMKPRTLADFLPTQKLLKPTRVIEIGQETGAPNFAPKLTLKDFVNRQKQLPAPKRIDVMEEIRGAPDFELVKKPTLADFTPQLKQLMAPRSIEIGVDIPTGHPGRMLSRFSSDTALDVVSSIRPGIISETLLKVMPYADQIRPKTTKQIVGGKTVYIGEEIYGDPNFQIVDRAKFVKDNIPTPDKKQIAPPRFSAAQAEGEGFSMKESPSNFLKRKREVKQIASRSSAKGYENYLSGEDPVGDFQAVKEKARPRTFTRSDGGIREQVLSSTGEPVSIGTMLSDVEFRLLSEKGSIGGPKRSEMQKRLFHAMSKKDKTYNKKLDEKLSALSDEDLLSAARYMSNEKTRPAKSGASENSVAEMAGNISDPHARNAVYGSMLQNASRPVMERYKDILSAAGHMVDSSRTPHNLFTRRKPAITGDAPAPRSTEVADFIPGAVTASPYYQMMKAFDPFNHPVVDAMEANIAVMSEVARARKIFKTVLKDIPDSSKILEKKLRPIFEEYMPTLKEFSRANNKKDSIKRELDLIKDENLRKSKKEELKKQRAKIRAIIKGPKAKSINEKHTKITNELAREHSDVRVALAAEDKLPEGISLSATEKNAVNHIREYMSNTKKDLDAVGIPTIEGDYMTHLVGKIGASGTSNRFLSFMKPKPKEIMTFSSRVPHSKQWFPSANAIMDHYVPVAEYKVGYQPFLNKWSRGRGAGSYSMLEDSPVRDYMGRWMEENHRKVREGAWDKLIDYYTSFEYARLIGGSTSVAFKHLLKQTATFTSLGSRDYLAGVKHTARVPVQFAMERLGIKGEHAELRLAEHYLKSKSLTTMMEETPAMIASKKIEGPIDAIDAGFSILREVSKHPTALVEAFDNGISLFGAINKSQRKGMTHQQATSAIWDTILTTNFRSGWDGPLWQKGAGMRAVTMFQMTPFKLMEFKKRLIQGAIRGEKDVFGEKYGSKLVKLIALVGLAEAAANANDTSVWLDHIAHPAFIRHKKIDDENKWIPAFPPVLDFASKIASKGLTDGIKSYFDWWGQVSKEMKIAEGDIPYSYESEAKYRLGLKEAEGTTLLDLFRDAANITDDDAVNLFGDSPVKVQAIREETGEQFDIEIPLAEALKTVDTDTQRFEELLEALK